MSYVEKFKPATDELIAHLTSATREADEHVHPPTEDCFCLNLRSFAGERMGPVLRRLADEEVRVRKALDIALEFGDTDGAHHKSWVIDQMVRTLAGDRYAEVIAGEEWDEGIAP